MSIAHFCNKYIWNDAADKLTEIVPGKLYLGNWKCALQLPPEIKHVINMTPHIPNFYSLWSSITYFSCPIPDTPTSDVMQHFEAAYDFIERVAHGKPVMVHCVVGASRSSSVVIAYLMKKNQWDTQTALDYVKQKRPIAKPNSGFLEQLHSFGQKLGTEKVTVQKVETVETVEQSQQEQIGEQ